MTKENYSNLNVLILNNYTIIGTFKGINVTLGDISGGRTSIINSFDELFSVGEVIASNGVWTPKSFNIEIPIKQVISLIIKFFNDVILKILHVKHPNKSNYELFRLFILEVLPKKVNNWNLYEWQNNINELSYSTLNSI